MALFGAVLFMWCLVTGIRSGLMPIFRSLEISRARFPAVYWVLAALYACLAAFGAYSGIMG